MMETAMIVRVCMREVGPDTDRLRFDVSLGSDMKPLPDIAYFGYIGPFNGDEISAGALLNADGQIDLGFWWARNNRFHKTNLLTKRIEIGQYVTVWWDFESTAKETTYVIEAVTQLSAVTELISRPDATRFQCQKIDEIPRFRGRVKNSFDIRGYDKRVYRPPIGVEGDIANFQGAYYFCPDNAVAKNGDLIMVLLDPENIEMITENFGPGLGRDQALADELAEHDQECPAKSEARGNVA